MIRRSLTLAVLGALALTIGAVALLHRLTEPEAASAVAAAAPAERLAPPGVPPAVEDPPTPVVAQPLNPLVQVEVGAQPPPLPAGPQARSDRLIEIREQRRDTALDQQNAREAARRARLGLPPAPAAPAGSAPSRRRPMRDS
jgi:hypothetical protein